MINEYNAAIIYQVFASIVGIVLGTIAILFTKKLNELQIRYASKHKDSLNKKLAENLSHPYMPIVTKLVGVGLIVISVLQLLKLY